MEQLPLPRLVAPPAPLPVASPPEQPPEPGSVISLLALAVLVSGADDDLTEDLEVQMCFDPSLGAAPQPIHAA